VDVPSAIAVTRLTNAHAKSKELVMLLTNFVFMIVFFLIYFSCFGLLWLFIVRSYVWPFTGVQNGNQREVMQKGGFAALSRYGGATTDSADFTDRVLNRRKQRDEDYGPFVAIHRTALYSLRYLLFGKVRSRCVTLRLRSGQAWRRATGSVLSVESVVNSLSARGRRPAFAKAPAWLADTALFWGKRVYDFFEAGFPGANGYFLTWETPGELFQLG
jgi:hypothetical protein